MYQLCYGCYDALTYARCMKFQTLIHESELDEESESFSEVGELEERFLFFFLSAFVDFGLVLVSRSMAWNSELVTVSSMSSSASTSQTKYWRKSWATCMSWCRYEGICEEPGELQAIFVCPQPFFGDSKSACTCWLDMYCACHKMVDTTAVKTQVYVRI